MHLVPPFLNPVESMTSLLLLKLFLVPFLIYVVTQCGRRWGPGVAGWLSAFPIVAGPILLAISLEQGAAFAAAAAEGTLMAVIAILVFGLAYAWASARCGVAGSMAIALLAYALAVAGLQVTRLDLASSFVVVCVALWFAPRCFPKLLPTQAPRAPASNDLPWRMLAGAALVVSVTLAASHIGPRLSGFLAMFPVMGSVLTGFSHAAAGRAFAVALLRGMVFGYYAFAVFCVTVSLFLRQGSIAIAFAAAFACALVVQVGVKRISTGLAGSTAAKPTKA